MARSLRRCIGGPYGSGQLHDDFSSSLQGTYDSFVFPGPSTASYCQVVSSIASTGSHLLVCLASLILVGFFFCFSCVAHLFSDDQWTSINKTLEAMQYTSPGSMENTGCS